MSDAEPRVAGRALLQWAILEAIDAAGPAGADVWAIVNHFGQAHPAALGSTRERLMTEVRQMGLARIERQQQQTRWFLTDAGRQLLLRDAQW